VSSLDLDGGETLARASGMSWQTIEGEMVLLNVDRGELLGLSEVGGRIWELVDGTHTVAQIVAAIAAEFDVAPATAEADVRAFLAELVACGALELSGARAPG
jgi:hypothetical protein